MPESNDWNALTTRLSIIKKTMYRSISRRIHRQLHGMIHRQLQGVPEFIQRYRLLRHALSLVLHMWWSSVTATESSASSLTRNRARNADRHDDYFSFRDRYVIFRNHDCKQAVFERVDPQLWIYAGLHGVSNDGQYRGESRYWYMYLLLLLFASRFRISLRTLRLSKVSQATEATHLQYTYVCFRKT